MKAIVQSEFAYLRTFVPSSLAIFVLVYVFLCYSLQTSAMISILCAMEPLLALFGIANSGMVNGWDRFRAALPFSRSDVVVGRYLAILLSSVVTVVIAFALGMVGNVAGSAVVPGFDDMPLFELAATCICSAAISLVLVACMQPFLVVIGLGIAWLSQVLDAPMMYEVADWIEANAGLMVVGIAAIGALALAASCAISLRIYKRKDL